MAILLLAVALGCLAGAFFTTKFLIIVSGGVAVSAIFMLSAARDKELGSLVGVLYFFTGVVFVVPAWLVWFFMSGVPILPSIRNFVFR